MKNNVKQFLKSFLSLKPIRNKTVSNGTALWVSAAILFTQIADALSTKLGLQQRLRRTAQWLALLHNTDLPVLLCLRF